MVIGWGIIGLGIIVDRVMASSLNSAENSQLVAVCSRSLDKAKDFAERHNVEGAYDSYKEMLKDPNLDAVYVATPNNMHVEPTVLAAQAGKHILCEKPMDLTAAGCERMIEACEKNNVKLAINFPSRFTAANVEIRRLIEEGIVGDMLLVKSQSCYDIPGDTTKDPNVAGTEGWRLKPSMAGAGALMGPGLHPIDLMRFLLNDEIEEVMALLEPQGEDVVDSMEYIIFKFAGGTRYIAISGLTVPRSDNGIVLYGKNAKVTCQSVMGAPRRDEIVVEGDSINMRLGYSSPDPGSRRQSNVIEYLNKCITEDMEPVISSGRNGLQMVKIVSAIVESSRTGQAIKVS